MSIAERLKDVRLKITAAAKKSGRSDDAIRLVAVSKTFPPPLLQEAIACGQLEFGENYIPEGSQKAEFIKSIEPQAKFHFIGSLQRNKVRSVVKSFDLIHSVDRTELGLEINKEAARLGRKMPILLQVNISDEASKSGVRADELLKLAQELIALENLSLEGIMSIGSALSLNIDQPENLKIVCDEFYRMAELRKSLERSLGVELKELSMGMSSDFESAIGFGATIVRVGSAIFGQR